MSAAAERVLVSIEAGVAQVTLNRADKRNALDLAMFHALAEAGAAVAGDNSVRAVVLSGAGKSFCAGLDLAAFATMAPSAGDDAETPGHSAGSALRMHESGLTHRAQQAVWTWQQVPVPVIAALQGHALGGGIQLALGADIRVCHPATKLSVRELHFGLIPDMTGTLVLSRLVRPDIAKELVFSARIFDGVEALRLGIVTRLSETPLDDALAMAAEIAAQRSPEAIRGAKALINRLVNADAGAQFAAEREVVTQLIGSPNQIESVVASFGNRPPQFVDPE